jgi:hypothetical protein
MSPKQKNKPEGENVPSAKPPRPRRSLPINMPPAEQEKRENKHASDTNHRKVADRDDKHQIRCSSPDQAKASTTDFNHSCDYRKVFLLELDEGILIVYKDEACKASIFFQEKVNDFPKDWEKHPWMYIPLPGFSSDEFKVWIHWTYHGEFVTDTVEAYFLGRYLGDAKFADAWLGAQIARAHEWRREVARQRL